MSTTTIRWTRLYPKEVLGPKRIPQLFLAAPVTPVAGRRRKDCSPHRKRRAGKEVALPTKLRKMVISYREWAKKSITSPGLQRVFLIRQNIIAQSALLEQEALNKPPSFTWCSRTYYGVSNDHREDRTYVFSLLMYAVTCNSTGYLNSMVHYPVEMGES